MEITKKKNSLLLKHGEAQHREEAMVNCFYNRHFESLRSLRDIVQIQICNSQNKNLISKDLVK